MDHVLHATFDSADDGIRAVKLLLYHGLHAEDINLILPQPRDTAPTAKRSAAQAATSAAVSTRPTAVATDADVPYPPPLPPRPRHDDPQYYGGDDLMAPGATGYRYDELGAVIPDPVPPRQPKGSTSPGDGEAGLDTEEGIGLGLGLGMLAALCVPGIGLIVGSGAIVVDLMTGGVVAGGIAGGIYGYLIDRGVDRQFAQVMSHHLEGGGTTLSVTVPEAIKRAEIKRILIESGGDSIGQSYRKVRRDVPEA